MITEPGRPDYPLPENFGRFRSVALWMGADWLELQPISPGRIDEAREALSTNMMPLRGVPVYYAVTDRMVMWPAPSGVWEVARSWDAGPKDIAERAHGR